MGLLDAAALAEALTAALEEKEADALSSKSNSEEESTALPEQLQQAAESYAAKRGVHVRFYQSCGDLLTPFYQSDSRLLPTSRDIFFEPVSRIPFMRKIITSLGPGLMLQPFRHMTSVPREIK